MTIEKLVIIWKSFTFTFILNVLLLLFLFFFKIQKWYILFFLILQIVIFEISLVYNLSKIYNIASYKNKSKKEIVIVAWKKIDFYDSMIMTICSCTVISKAARILIFI